MIFVSQCLTHAQAVDKPKEPPKPNFAPSGLLAKETNTVQGVQLKYNEPPEARKPLKNWRLYVFKGKDQIGMSGFIALELVSNGSQRRPTACSMLSEGQ